MDSIVFTPASLIDLLSKIEELSDYPIGITETLDGQIQLNVGESLYIIDTDSATDIQVDNSVVDIIEDTNQDAYENLDEDIDVVVGGEGEEEIEAGLIKALAKTLLVGGIVRLAGKVLKDNL